jgi:predicted metal-binding membrane protein
MSFASGWIAMTAAMMLPSAIPFVVSFVRSFSRSRLVPVAAGLIVTVYLAVWLVFGLGLFAVSTVVPMPVRSPAVIVAAVAFAGVYALTPLRRAGEAGCMELCRPFAAGGRGALKAALSRGAVYGACCVMCTAGVMLAVFVVGMSDVRVWLVGAAAVFVMKARGWRVIARPAGA